MNFVLHFSISISLFEGITRTPWSEKENTLFGEAMGRFLSEGHMLPRRVLDELSHQLPRRTIPQIRVKANNILRGKLKNSVCDYSLLSSNTVSYSLQCFDTRVMVLRKTHYLCGLLIFDTRFLYSR